jgi:hypothetical protein
MEKLVVLLSGKIDSGKNTFADYLLQHLAGKATSEYFARPLKEMCRDAFRPLSNYLNEQDLSGTDEEITDASWFEQKTEVTRRILQIVGTDIVRKVDNFYFARATVAAIDRAKSDIVVITDWRFNSEAAYLSEQGFNTLSIRVNRALPRFGDIHSHISETELDTFPFDLIIDNNGTLSDLNALALNVAHYLIEEHLE